MPVAPVTTPRSISGPDPVIPADISRHIPRYSFFPSLLSLPLPSIIHMFAFVPKLMILLNLFFLV